MKVMERELKAILQELAPQQAINANRLASHVKALHSACREIDGKFPPGSNSPHSHALPAIWEQPHQFDRLMKELHQRSETLSRLDAVSASREELLDAVKEIGAACQRCHETFRRPQG